MSARRVGVVVVAVGLLGAFAPEHPAASGTMTSRPSLRAQSQQPPASQAPPTGTAVPQTADRTRTIAMIGIIVLAVVYLRLADIDPRRPRSLVNFGRPDVGDGEDDGHADG